MIDFLKVIGKSNLCIETKLRCVVVYKLGFLVIFKEVYFKIMIAITLFDLVNFYGIGKVFKINWNRSQKIKVTLFKAQGF